MNKRNILFTLMMCLASISSVNARGGHTGKHAGRHFNGHGAGRAHNYFGSLPGYTHQLNQHRPFADKNHLNMKEKKAQRKAKKAAEKANEKLKKHPHFKHGGHWEGDTYVAGVVRDPYPVFYDRRFCISWPWYCGMFTADVIAAAQRYDYNGNGE